MKESYRLLFLAFVMFLLLFSAVYYSKKDNIKDDRYEVSFMEERFDD